MLRAVIAGLAYFACIFAVGFALGAPRTILIAPWLGETLAVAFELPVILVAAWIICGWLTRRFRIAAMFADRAVMGLSAFLLLLVGEAAISLLFGSRSLAEHLQLYRETSHQLGLAGQAVFALFPLLQRRWVSADLVCGLAARSSHFFTIAENGRNVGGLAFDHRSKKCCRTKGQRHGKRGSESDE